MPRSKQLTRKALALSEGVLSTLTDLTLFLIATTIRLGTTTSTHPAAIARAFREVNRDLAEINYQSLKRSIKTLFERGWIKGNLVLSKAGQRRLTALIPQHQEPPAWDGKWRLVIFDIPNALKGKRESLRAALKQLGFGQLQESVWISPYPFLGDVETIVKKLRLLPHVVLAVSQHVGRERAKDLCEKVWHANEVNAGYRSFIGTKNPRPFVYLAVLARDPQLPRELLPDDWLGEKAYEYFQKSRPPK